MNLNNLSKIKYVDRMQIALLAVIIVCTLAPATSTRASSIVDEWDEVFDTARAVLARIDVARIETTKDPTLREAAMSAYRALKACAKVNRNQSRSIKQATVAEFERAFKVVETEAERGEYQSCASKCKSDGEKCEKECASDRKKLCSCKMTEFGCFAAKCLVS
jgi:hypothetical protein